MKLFLCLRVEQGKIPSTKFSGIFRPEYLILGEEATDVSENLGFGCCASITSICLLIASSPN